MLSVPAYSKGSLKMRSDKSKGSASGPTITYTPVELKPCNSTSCSTGSDKHDNTAKLMDTSEVYAADVGSVFSGNLISSTHVKKGEFCTDCAEGNSKTSMRVLHDGLDKFKPLELGSYEGTVLEVLSSSNSGEAKTMDTLDFGDLVWGKVVSHPWWPGQIYNESLAPSSARHTKKDGSVLVAFFGDFTYAWLNHDQVIPFEPHFEEKSKKTKLRSFTGAVKEALDELKRRAALGLTCFCQHPGNFLPTRIKGFYKVDVEGYAPGAIYSSKQIGKSRDGFQPHEMFSFVKQLALSPRSTQNVDGIINCAKVNAYRKAVFDKNDETYDQAFDEFEKVDKTCDQAFAVKASRSDVPVEFPKYRDQLEGMAGAQAIVEAPNGSAVLLTSSEIVGLERTDCFTVEIPCTDIASDSCGPAGLNYELKDTASEVSMALVESKSSQALDVPIMVIEETREFPALFFGASVPDDKESSKDQGDSSKESCKGETKRKRKEESQPDAQGKQSKLQKDATFDKPTFYQKSSWPDKHEKTYKRRTLHTKKHGAKKLLTPREGDETNIQAALPMQSEKKSPKDSALKAEPTKLVVKFSPQTTLPTSSELKAKFAYFGPLDESATCISWESATCEVVFMHKSNALAAYDYALQTRTLFDNSDVNYQLMDFVDLEECMGESFDEIQSFEGEPYHMFNVEMKSLPRELPGENSMCMSNAARQGFPKSNTINKFIACDNQEGGVSSSVKFNIGSGSENSPEVFSEMLCASSSVCSSIQYKNKVGSLDETVAAINRKYSMDEGWKSLYQRNLTAIASAEFSNQLTDLLQKCNDIVGEFDP